MVCVVASVSQEALEGATGLDESLGDGDVVGIAGAEQQHGGTAKIVHEAVDLGGSTPSGAAYALEEGPPFSAGRRAVSLDGGAVDGGAGVDAAVAGQGLEDAMPDALTAPAVEAGIDRRVRPVLHRAIAPPRARLQHVDNTAQNPAVIHVTSALAAPGKMRLDPSPSLVVQPVKLAHSKLPSSSLESEQQPHSQTFLSTDLIV